MLQQVQQVLLLLPSLATMEIIFILQHSDLTESSSSEVDELSLGEGGESWDGEGESASSQCGDDDGLGDGDSVQQDEEAGHQHLDNQPHDGLECWRLL